MARFGRSYPVPRRGAPLALFAPQIIAGAGVVSGNFTAVASPTVTDPTSGVLSATFSAGFSPEGVGTTGTVTATFSAAGAPVVTLSTSGVIAATFSASATAGVQMVASGTVSGNFAAGFVPEGIGIPSAVSANFTAIFSPVGIGIPSVVTSFFSVGYAPEDIGVPGVVAATFSATPSLVVQYTVAGAVTGLFSVGIATLPAVSLPWNQPGNQYVTDLLSFGLHANYRIYVTVGVPTVNLGNNGDLAFRRDGVSGSQVYHRTSGLWSAIA